MASGFSYSAVTISQLVLDRFNTKFLALVVNKGEPRSVNLRKGETKSVLNFTLRDSESDSINASVWGDKHFVEGLGSEFHLGDVVEIRNAIIQAKRDENSKFNPSVSSPYQLSFSETRGEVKLRCDLNTKFQHLLQCVPPSFADCYTISDLIYSADNVTGHSVSLLAVVKKVDAVTELVTKDGRPLKKLDLQIFDKSNSSFRITLWGGELCEFAFNILKPKMVVLFCDLRAQFNDRLKLFTASSTSATTLVIKPNLTEAHDLLNHAETIELDSLGDECALDLSKMKDLPKLSVSQIEKNLLDNLQRQEGDLVVIVDGFLSHFDLDGILSNVIIEQCSKCHKLLKSGTDYCANEICQTSNGGEPQETEKIYSMNCAVSDHTGTIENCMMKGDAIRDIIGVEVTDFVSLTDKEKTLLKWKYLLERCKVVLSIPRHSAGPRCYSRVLHYITADLEQLYGEL